MLVIKFPETKITNSFFLHIISSIMLGLCVFLPASAPKGGKETKPDNGASSRYKLHGLYIHDNKLNASH